MNAAMIRECTPVEISDTDVLDAMKAMRGYIDITIADFKEVYRVAYALARERMMNAVKAADVMTAPVHCVEAEMSLIETATLLAAKGVSGAPVVNGQGKIVGVISEKDFLRQMGAGRTGSFMEVIVHCLKSKGCLASPMHARQAGDLMTAPPIAAKADISIAQISSLFMDKHINRLPIVDKEARPIGIVTRSDLVSSYCMLS